MLQRRNDANVLHTLKILHYTRTNRSHHMKCLKCGGAMWWSGCEETKGILLNISRKHAVQRGISWEECQYPVCRWERNLSILVHWMLCQLARRFFSSEMHWFEWWIALYHKWSQHCIVLWSKLNLANTNGLCVDLSINCWAAMWKTLSISWSVWKKPLYHESKTS